ncbi:preprotein translocase subunit SecE [Hydrogenivirga sp. 128-5-R1-1]|uniref:preprotein translocase subunit SecE n=1 Tax=Hydrogenivirga sp. 128-5-R1-1 TaxID=392423 RepID=UPI000516DC61|nr:preprotein translocase subunit SecE [Hydrogenivirga sp. 128-5-R1-1]
MNASQLVNFLKEVKDELKKVTWPTSELVKKATIAVIVFTLLVSVYLWVLDIAFSRIIDYLFR